MLLKDVCQFFWFVRSLVRKVLQWMCCNLLLLPFVLITRSLLLGRHADKLLYWVNFLPHLVIAGKSRVIHYMKFRGWGVQWIELCGKKKFALCARSTRYSIEQLLEALGFKEVDLSFSSSLCCNSMCSTFAANQKPGK